MDKPTRSLTSEERAELAEKRLAEALQQLEQERQRILAMEAKLQELKIPLDFLPAVNPSMQATSEQSDRPLQNHSTQKTATIQSIYTDGACSGNPGRGGWGVVVYFTDGSVFELGGADAQTTNNRMEMQAAIAALQFLAESGQTEPVIFYTDSEYVKKGINDWIHGWKKKGWKTSTGKAVLNKDLWQMLDELNSRTGKDIAPVEWRYVRGHSGNVGNDRCDTIARAYATGGIPTLKQ